MEINISFLPSVLETKLDISVIVNFSLYVLNISLEAFDNLSRVREEFSC